MLRAVIPLARRDVSTTLRRRDEVGLWRRGLVRAADPLVFPSSWGGAALSLSARREESRIVASAAPRLGLSLRGWGLPTSPPRRFDDVAIVIVAIYLYLSNEDNVFKWARERS